MSWTGAWVQQQVGVQVRDAGLLPGLAAEDLVGLALRVNPKRPHLLVSRVLAKHVPTDPRVVRAAGLLLGLRVARVLGRGADVDHELPALLGDVLREQGDVVKLAAAVEAATAEVATAGAEPDPGLVFGYAETATGLGHLVARALRLPVIHSTRRHVTGHLPALDFEEAHSHATEHLVLPDDPLLLTSAGPVVLVDDELSTGSTALNTIRALHAIHPRATYLIAVLVDVRRAADRERMAAVADELGVTIDVVALASGEVVVPDDAVARVAQLPAASGSAPAPRSATAERPAALRGWPVGVREGGRHGFTPSDEAALEAAADTVAAELGAVVGERVLVLGTEELMHAPLMIADALQRRRDTATVRFSSTTRSPVQVRDEGGYAVRSGITYGAHDRDAQTGARFAYNVADESWSDIVVVLDAPTWSAGVAGLLEELAPYAQTVRPVVLPVLTGRPRELRGPAFGSYAPEEVTWLLTDLSHVRLEADLATRERAIQAGEAHYAESLPVEYQPEESYRRLFHQQLDEVAARVATAVGVVSELSMATRGRDDLVLVSLARAGTPIGVLMRRWAARQGLDWPHYTISIVRDRGIDMVAMRHLADRYDPARILFVDGWTGKGAITREFADAVQVANAELGLGGAGEPDGFRSDLAVLADPGECVELYGTRDDFLIPSACLNSTVSGLVSRTVLNRDLIGADDFHGAKFYAELADQDVSGLYLDRVTAEYDAVAEEVAAQTSRLLDTDRTPTWVGWQAAERIRAEHGLPHINLVKPGVGETTRVLLRRVPWKVVVNPERRADLRHVEMLAAERGVEVVPVEGLPYSCVGLIRPTEKDSS